MSDSDESFGVGQAASDDDDVPIHQKPNEHIDSDSGDDGAGSDGFAIDDVEALLRDDGIVPSTEDKTRARRQQKRQRRRARDKKGLPVEHLRSLIRGHGTLVGGGHKEHRVRYIYSLPYVPLAVYKLLENMPMPWENTHDVGVIFHQSGVLTMVDDTPTVAEPLYRAQWGATWTAMRMHKYEVKQSGGFFNRIKFPLFDSHTPPLDYVDHIATCRLPDPVRNEYLDPVEDRAVLEWFYATDPVLVPPCAVDKAHVAGTESGHFGPTSNGHSTGEWAAPRSGGRWYFTVDVVATLLRLAESVFLQHRVDPNWYFLWDMRSFYSAKAMHLAIPRGPHFEALHYLSAEERAELDDDWTAVNDLYSVIVRDDPRQPALTMQTERTIQFPHLYSPEVRGVQVAPYHYTPRVFSEPPVEEDVPTFSWDPALNPVIAVRKTFTDQDVKRSVYEQHRTVLDNTTYAYRTDRADSDCEAPPGLLPLEADELIDYDLDIGLPDNFAPFLADLPLEDASTRDGLRAYHALGPYNTFAGGMKRRLDVPLVQDWAEDPVHLIPEEYPSKVNESYTKLLKRHVKRSLKKEKATAQAIAKGLNTSALRKEEEAIPGTLELLRDSKFYHQTRMDWVEAGLQLLRQGHHMLRQLLNMKGLPYVHVNFNFDAQPTRELTTKERKKSRLGPAFHLTRECLKLAKYAIDAHVQFRRGLIDAFQLADGLHYLFNHLGKLTGFYQYKYRTMRQARECRDIKHLLYHRFNAGEVQRGPGNGFWGPSWRVVMQMMRGMTPLLHRFLSNLVNRLFEGRKYKAMARRITKQRIEADTDVTVKDNFRRELGAMLPDGAQVAKLLKHGENWLNDAFRSWKRNAPWDPELNPALKELVRRYVRLLSDNYVRQAQYNRERISSADAVDKTMFKKNLGRLTRLKLMDEQERQKKYLAEGPYVSPEEAKSILGMMRDWFDARGFEKIPFPKQSHPAEMELLKLSLSRLREQHNIGHRLNQSQREEQKRIEDALDNPHVTLADFRDRLVRQRQFKPVNVEFMDHFSHLVPMYDIEPREKMLDSYLDQYLWYEATERGLFPNWVKPADNEPLPVLVHRFCEGINNSPGIWQTDHGESVVLLQASIEEDFYNNVDWNLFRPILEIILDKTIVDYIISRHNVIVEYKDMQHAHTHGLIRGFQFASFLAQVWGVVIDLTMLGPQRALQIAGTRHDTNTFMQFRSPQHASCHNIRGYLRYKDQFCVLLRFSKDQCDELRREYAAECREAGDSTYKYISGFKNKKCWPRDARMRLSLADVNLARAVLAQFQGRLPPGIANLSADNAFVSVYSSYNPNLLFDLAGFEVRIQPAHRVEGALDNSENMWRLRNAQTGELTARAYLQVTKAHVKRIQNKIRHAIMSVGNATFQAIAAKWNAVLIEIIPFYREAIGGTDGLREIFVKGEKKMQQRVMMALNSKAAARFPPVIFYSPQEPTGGLGMYSVAQSLIPRADTQFSTLSATGAQTFMSGLTNADGIDVPNFINFFPSWESEIEEGQKAWSEFHRERLRAKSMGLQLSCDSIQDLLDKGIPRIRTQFMRDAKLYRFDAGFRTRQEFQQYIMGRQRRDWWYHREHDGALLAGAQKRYEGAMTNALGGVGCILEHSLFKATGLTSWEGLLWNTSGTFEQSKRDAKITKAQRGGLTNVPNRRFALWWSPTINRSDIFTGYQVQIPSTGVFMHGKLVTVQTSMLGVFDKNRWARVHFGVVTDIAKKLCTEECQSSLRVAELSDVQIHPHKSFTFSDSAADVVLVALDDFEVSNQPSTLTESDATDDYSKKRSKTFWIDVQLRWGNYDNHNIALYAREKFSRHTQDGVSRYPGPAGVVVAIDLAYCCYSAFGYWIPGLKGLLQKLIEAVNRSNMQLNELRDVLKRSLQLQTSNPTEANLSVKNFGEIFSDQINTWIVDDSQTRFKDANGAVTIVNPVTGDLFLTIVHKSVFIGQKRGKKLAAEKAAEAIATWIRSLAPNERPKKIIVTRGRFRPVLNSVLQDPNVTVIQADINLEVSQLLFHSRLGKLRTDATTSKTYRMQIYDDWLNTFPATTAFYMLKLILRGYYYNIDQSRRIIDPDAGVAKNPKHLWPTYNRDEWADVCQRLQTLIIAEACRRNKINPQDLTQSEKNDILMGKKFTNQELREDEVEEQRTIVEKRALEAPERVTYVNSSGETVTKTVRAKLQAVSVDLKARTWQSRARHAADTSERLEHVHSAFNMPASGHVAAEVVFPDDSLAKFLRACDASVSTVAFLFGRKVPQAPHVSEVACILIPPQRGAVGEASTPAHIPVNHPLLDPSTGLHFIGVLRSQAAEGTPNSGDLVLAVRAAASLSATHTAAVEAAKATVGGDDEDGPGAAVPEVQSLLPTARYAPSTHPFFVCVAAIRDRDVVLHAYTVTEAGYAFGRDKLDASRNVQHEAIEIEAEHVAIAPSRITAKLSGSILVPVFGGGAWNYDFIGQFWADGNRDRQEYDVQVTDVPLEYFALAHRPEHSKAFHRMCHENDADVMDVDDAFN